MLRYQCCWAWEASWYPLLRLCLTAVLLVNFSGIEIKDPRRSHMASAAWQAAVVMEKSYFFPLIVFWCFLSSGNTVSPPCMKRRSLFSHRHSFASILKQFSLGPWTLPRCTLPFQEGVQNLVEGFCKGQAVNGNGTASMKSVLWCGCVMEIHVRLLKLSRRL